MHYNLVTFVKMHAVFFIKALCPTNNSIKVRGGKKKHIEEFGNCSVWEDYSDKKNGLPLFSVV